MTLAPLTILPIVAFAICLQDSWLWGDRNAAMRSRKTRRRIRARTVALRFLVASLLFATLITLLVPSTRLPQLMQGLVVTALLMTPVCLYLLFEEWWILRAIEKAPLATASQGNAPVPLPDQEPSSQTDAGIPVMSVTPDPDAVSRDAVSRDVAPDNAAATQAAPLPTSLTGVPLSLAQTASPAAVADTGIPSGTSAPAPSVTPSMHLSASSQPAVKLNEDQPTLHKVQKKPIPENVLIGQDNAVDFLDQTLNIDSHMGTLDDMVDYHDIGAADLSIHTASEEFSEEKTLRKSMAIARESMMNTNDINSSAENLPARSRTELYDMVLGLKSDKLKLQKLVIAQKAVIDSEKQAHSRTKVVVKDAITVMRKAREKQRIAEKIARRERAEKQRLEKDYIKVRRALDNALSTINEEETEVKQQA